MSYQTNIICHDDGWILNKMGLILHEFLPNSRLIYPKDYAAAVQRGELDQPDVLNYYMNYVLYRHRSQALDAAFFTHIEMDPQNENLKKFFIQAASVVDLAIFNAPMYMRLCEKITQRASVIVPGVDEHYRCQLRLGISGRAYDYTSRKNPELVAQLMQIPWLKIEFTGGGMAADELPDFYQRQDFVLVVSKVEGGPMSVLEALAMGKEVIFPRGVGLGELFVEGLHFFELDRPETLIQMLRRMYQKKASIAQIVEGYTWASFARQHKEKFDALMHERVKVF